MQHKTDTKTAVSNAINAYTRIIIRHATDPKFCQQDVDCHKNYKIHRTTTTQYVIRTSQST